MHGPCGLTIADREFRTIRNYHVLYCYQLGIVIRSCESDIVSATKKEGRVDNGKDANVHAAKDWSGSDPVRHAVIDRCERKRSYATAVRRCPEDYRCVGRGAAARLPMGCEGNRFELIHRSLKAFSAKTSTEVTTPGWPQDGKSIKPRIPSRFLSGRVLSFTTDGLQRQGAKWCLDRAIEAKQVKVSLASMSSTIIQFASTVINTRITS